MAHIKNSSVNLCTSSAPLCEINSKIAFSPRAQKLAAREGILMENIAGSGPQGRILERDIKAALAKQPLLTAAAKAAVRETISSMGTGIGGRIALNDLISTLPVSHSLPPPETAQCTLNAGANAVKLLELRKWLKSKAESKNENDAALAKITVTDMILYAVSRVLPAFNYMNAHQTGGVNTTFEPVHLGMAVDTPKGLMVPVIRNANRLTLKQISIEAKRLAAACRNGSAKPGELTGSTFTVSNLGSFGITGFTPALNTPEAGILGVCAIEMKPAAKAVKEEGLFSISHSPFPIYFAPHIGFSLTINHRAVDGAPAARFLKALCQAVEHIYLQLAIG